MPRRVSGPHLRPFAAHAADDHPTAVAQAAAFDRKEPAAAEGFRQVLAALADLTSRRRPNSRRS
jgi:hypothetical protein